MHEVGDFWFLRKSSQPLQQLWRVGVIAELLQRCDLGPHRHKLGEDFDLFGATLNRGAPCSWRLKSD